MQKFRDKIHRQLPNLSKADLHIHSNYSDGKPSIEEILDYVEQKTNLDVIAITDHDTIDGALLAKDLVKKKKYRFEVIVGEEVSSADGHIVGLFLNKKIPPKLSAHETMKQIRSQGGIAIPAHPFYVTRFNSDKVYAAKSVGSAVLLNEKANYDAIETINGIPTYHEENLKAKYINRFLLFKPEVGGSDAHILQSIAKGYTLFEGKTAPKLRQAIIDNQTQSMNDRWDIAGLGRYAYFLWPRGLRLLLRTIVFGRKEKEPQLITFPSRRKMEKEIRNVDNK